jgi:DNA-binding SARP family transcriptional activator
VTLGDGRVRVVRQSVWCVVCAFLARTGDAPPAGVTGPPRIDDLLSLYRGPLLGPGPAPDWAIGPREQLRSRFLRAVAAAGEAAEVAGRWQEAIAVYERGLEQDNLAEDLYRGLMRCHIALGESANALRAYRRCRDILSIVLGVKPTAETEALHKSVPGT